MLKRVVVGMADLKVSRPPCIMTTFGLGSCVGVAFYDNITKISGLAHIMLPSSKLAQNITNPAKFADAGIEKLLKDMLDFGARKYNIKAKIAGGAMMFNVIDLNDIFKIGLRNVKAVKEKIKELDIELLSEDTGENYGRTIELNSADGSLLIKTIRYGVRII